MGYKRVAVEADGVQIECVFFGPFRDAIGEKTVSVETTAATVGALLSELEARYPALSGRLLDPTGDGIAGEAAITKNARNIRHLDGLDTSLEADDVIRMTPAVYGG
ncbi:ubiquitin-like small modifier protein 1 [Haloferacaceae archaeon DSL9]